MFDDADSRIFELKALIIVVVPQCLEVGNIGEVRARLSHTGSLEGKMFGGNAVG